MKKWILLLLILISIKAKAQKSSLKDIPLIPKPQYIEAKSGQFIIDKETKLVVVDSLIWFADYFNQSMNWNLNTINKEIENAIIFSLLRHYDTLIGEEGYILDIDSVQLRIKANTKAGLFYGIQTLRQIIYFQGDSLPVSIPAGKIVDYPRFQYRGMMLDVARHFFTVQEVKQLIDYLSLFKINHLHLHLSDDQGWRIEIKQYPKLTEIGSLSSVGNYKGGYYTQEQFKDIVNYAQKRFISIVPEIDMPGHTNAALASYAFLNCDNKTKPLYYGTKVGFSSLCTSKDTVYKFVEIVISEITKLYSGRYFHIGGDESNATPHNEYLKFVDSVQKIVIKYGKVPIGWDEIAQSKLQPETIVQFWIHKEYAKLALDKGNKLLFSYAPRLYMDMKYHPKIKLGYRWAGYIEIDKAYNWDIADFGFNEQAVIGIEAPLWTETVKTLDDIEFMVFPRICAYSEISWTKPQLRNWNDFKTRLANFSSLFEKFGIDYYRSNLIDWK